MGSGGSRSLWSPSKLVASIGYRRSAHNRLGRVLEICNDELISQLCGLFWLIPSLFAHFLFSFFLVLLCSHTVISDNRLRLSWFLLALV